MSICSTHSSVLAPEEVDRFLTFVQAEEATLFYAKMPVEFGWIKGPKS